MAGSVFIRQSRRSPQRRPRWHVVAVVKDASGRWKQVRLGGYATRAEAAAAKHQAEAWLRAGGSMELGRQTVGEWCAVWLATGTWRPKTHAFYLNHVRRHIEPYLGQIPLQELRRTTISEWLRRLEQDGYGQATRAGAHRTLRAALSAAVRRDVIPANPAVGLRVPAPPTRAGAVWSREQLAAFLVTAEKTRWYPLLRFLAATGCRISEAAGLTWPQVNLQEGTVTFVRTLVRVRGQPTWSTPKTRRGRRTIRLDAETVATLRAWQEDQAAERRAAGTTWGGEWAQHSLVFTTAAGLPIDASGLRRTMRRIATAAGLPANCPCSPHVLRHSAVTLALSAGQPPALAAAYFGHDPSVMLQVYSGAAPQDAPIAATIAELLDRP